MPPIDPTHLGFLVEAPTNVIAVWYLWLLGPVLGRIGSKPGMVLGFVTGVLFATILAGVAPMLGLSGPMLLFVGLPAAFFVGFFLVGIAIAIGQNVS